MIPSFATVATAAAKKDKDAGVDKNATLALLIDVNLLTFERFSTVKNVAFTQLAVTPVMRKFALEMNAYGPSAHRLERKFL